MPTKYHYFFAAKLPTEAKTTLNKWVESKKAHFPFKRWVHPEDYHITLAFLGAVDGPLLEKTIESAKNIFLGEQSFKLTFSELATFGSPKSPRIFWAGVEESEELNQLQNKVYQHCIDIGFQLDKKPFHPHITIARKWGSDESYQKADSVIRSQQGEPLTFTVNEIVLYESHVEETPKYKEFASYILVE